MSPEELPPVHGVAVRLCLPGFSLALAQEGSGTRAACAESCLVQHYRLVHQPDVRYLIAGKQVALRSLKKLVRGDKPRLRRGLFS